MATYKGEVRQGLPRVPGGEPWPAGGQVAVGVAEKAPSQETAAASQPTAVAEPTAPAAASAPVIASSSARVIRQGLPRVAGGEPWPPSGTLASGPVASPASDSAPQSSPQIDATQAETGQTETGQAESVQTDSALADEGSTTALPAAGFTASETPLRRGLPRVPGGEQWPAEGFAPQTPAPRTPAVAPAVAPAAAPVVAPAAQTAPAHAPAAAPADSRTSAASEPAPVKPVVVEKPAAAATPAKPVRDPIMIGAKSLAQWTKIVVLGALGAVFAAAIIVLAARGVTTLPGVPEWLKRYPGEYALPAAAEPGFPAWARWGHFFNLFLMVLIIRSGWLVRTQQKPPAFWTPKKGGKKISINLWLHTSLDVLWVVNGIVFVVLLFASGHWMRIVPTSWEVFPNALSSMLQYLTLDWPVEDGWVNYNSLQQLMYFIIVFIAAPVAIITGARMSEWWPQNATKLNKLYPAPLARAIHFPTMLFFVLFIMAHVFLVLTTGALKNLNHMFVGTPVVSWTGFWLFALSIAVTAAGWFACKPLVLAPIANMFGKVSNR